VIETARSVLVTGAGGLVGRQVVRLLAAQGDAFERVVAVDVRPIDEVDHQPGVEYCTADIRDPDFGKLFQRYRVDTVVHLAAIVTPGKKSSRQLEYEIDVLGTKNVLHACIATGVKRFVYTSSGAAYGYHADNPALLKETDALRGNEEFPYAHHKRLAEEMLTHYRTDHPELSQLIFRPGTILGETVHNPITDMFTRPVIVGVAGSEAPFVLIWDEDVARCIVQGIREGRSGIYNLTGDGVITLRAIAQRIGKPYVALPTSLLAAALWLLHALGLSSRGPEQVKFLRYRPVLSNERLKSEFGFTPTFTSEQCFEHYQRLRFPGQNDAGYARRGKSKI
jgi:UDP-glucose 4-epimerase